MFRTIASPSSGASSHKLYNALVRSCYQEGQIKKDAIWESYHRLLEMKTFRSFLIGKSKVNNLLGRPKYRWMDNNILIDICESRDKCGVASNA